MERYFHLETQPCMARLREKAAVARGFARFSESRTLSTNLSVWNDLRYNTEYTEAKSQDKRHGNERLVGRSREHWCRADGLLHLSP